MDHRTKICLWIIIIGLANFLLYTVGYVILNGEAIHGRIVIEDGQKHYFLQSGNEVSREVFLYSGVHSISIWPTVMAVMLAMLTLAKDRISASMHSAVVRGRVLMTVFAVIIGLMSAMLTYDFAHTFVHRFEKAEARMKDDSPAASPAGGAHRAVDDEAGTE